MSVFFRGTAAGQDHRFTNKHAKAVKQVTAKAPAEYGIKISMSKVKKPLFYRWIGVKITELLDGVFDEIAIDTVTNYLDGENPDPSELEVLVTGILGKKARSFVTELWSLLAQAQENASGIPSSWLERTGEKSESDARSRGTYRGRESRNYYPEGTLASQLAEPEKPVAKPQTRGEWSAIDPASIQSYTSRSEMERRIAGETRGNDGRDGSSDSRSIKKEEGEGMKRSPPRYRERDSRDYGSSRYDRYDRKWDRGRERDSSRYGRPRDRRYRSRSRSPVRGRSRSRSPIYDRFGRDNRVRSRSRSVDRSRSRSRSIDRSRGRRRDSRSPSRDRYGRSYRDRSRDRSSSRDRSDYRKDRDRDRSPIRDRSPARDGDRGRVRSRSPDRNRSRDRPMEPPK